MDYKELDKTELVIFGDLQDDLAILVNLEMLISVIAPKM